MISNELHESPIPLIRAVVQGLKLAEDYDDIPPEWGADLSAKIAEAQQACDNATLLHSQWANSSVYNPHRYIKYEEARNAIAIACTKAFDAELFYQEKRYPPSHKEEA